MRIVSIKCLEQSIVRHDIEVEDNNNFVAEGIVVHNSNARYVFHEGRMYCGSRTEWKKEYPNYSHITRESLIASGTPEEKIDEILSRINGRDKPRNMWWKALDATPSLRAFCEANTNTVVYGEVYGAVQDLAYGHNKGEISFVAFDVMVDGKYLRPLDAIRAVRPFGVPWVPIFNDVMEDVIDNRMNISILQPIPYDFDTLCAMAEGKTTMPGANHVREGVVVCPMEERRHDAIGRVKLKIVGAGYLEKSK